MIINVSEYDFERLVTGRCDWSGIAGLGKYSHGFEMYMEGENPFKPVFPGWKHIYYVGSEYSSVIFCRSFLDSIGETYEILFDLDNDSQWCIVTNYEHPVWCEHADEMRAHNEALELDRLGTTR